MLEANALTLTQNEKFRQMLDQPDKWMIRTLSIKCSVKTTLACLKKCDPMHLTGVEFKSNEPEVTDLASPFNILGDEGILTLEYNALKAFYKMRDDSRNQSPLLKRLRVRYHTHSESPATIGLVKETFDKVAFITKDFPNLEWLIIHEEKSIWPISGDTGNDLQAWEDLFKQFITILKETKLVKLALYIPWGVLEPPAGPRSGSSRGTIDVRVHGCYLRLARRLVESVEGLKDVAIMYKHDYDHGYHYDFRCHYRATQSDSGTINVKQVRTSYKFEKFPHGLLDTWA
ncbi:hypothetical protein DER45DRAFT_642642 [Fusarium avenaceum]|nr:hypothetical protein DER45DRAFT_642642 [Fusarium avenaceum]